MSGPRVVNRHHFGKGELPTPWMYIGRGTPLGNPFTVKDYGEEKALALYKKWLWEKIAQRDLAVLEALSQITEAHVVVCSCKPKPCHGDVVIAAWRWARRQKLLDDYAWAERVALQDERFN